MYTRNLIVFAIKEVSSRDNSFGLFLIYYVYCMVCIMNNRRGKGGERMIFIHLFLKLYMILL